MSKWQTVYQTSIDHKAQIVKDVLATSGIQSILFNLKDSAYNFGRVEIRVQSDQVIRAIRLIEEIDLK